ncbi:TPR domain (kinesin light chain) [Fusarium albosuccineum]|uniref:TPR domain (Kinesin light chain) n=1 Tax=Fusarium albosuccineum TaxID=1237068 RepID=A0A8H4PHG0_9HYPO|nr:TPR domain (kinesin light chain) [Fusarium albosuccineum]
MDRSTQFRSTATSNPSQASHGGLNTAHRTWRGQTQPQMHIGTMPFLPDPDFIERPDILTLIRDGCARAPHRIAIVGMGGIGKSHLAIHNAYRIREQHPDTWVFWVDGSTRERFRSSYRTIAERLDLPRRDDPKVDVLQLVSEWLQVEENGPWHMILDGADQVDVFFSTQNPLSSFLPPSRNGTIVITSRSIDVTQRLVGSERDILPVPPMTTDEAHSLLRAKLGNNIDDGETAKLVAALSYTPLAVTQAAALIDNGRVPIRQYLNEVQVRSQKKVSIPNKDASH